MTSLINLSRHGQAALSQRLKSAPSDFEITDMGSSNLSESAQCKDLIVAMVENLVMDLRGEGVTNRAGRIAERTREILKEEAMAFVFDESMEAFSFLWLCDYLNLDPDWFREQVSNGGICQWKLKEPSLLPDTTKITTGT